MGRAAQENRLLVRQSLAQGARFGMGEIPHLTPSRPPEAGEGQGHRPVGEGSGGGASGSG